MRVRASYKLRAVFLPIRIILYALRLVPLALYKSGASVNIYHKFEAAFLLLGKSRYYSRVGSQHALSWDLKPRSFTEPRICMLRV